ncbi:MAG: DUF6541 family protein [Promethearchaeota archaeon]
MIQFGLIIVIIINVLLALPRLYGGIPSGIDSNSHLFKCLYIYEFTKAFGYFPSWSDAWYGGYPISLFYPPLSYHVAVFVMHFGVPPLLAYKLIEIIFYALVTPLSIYMLTRGLKFKRESGLLAALLFSGIPETLMNLMRMDRYPNIIALPLVCLFLGIFFRMKGTKYFVLSYILLSSIFLTHHLTALYISLLFPFYILYQKLNGVKISKSFLVSLSVLFCAFILAAFWTFPFVLNLNQLQENPFINRSILGSHTIFDTFTDIKSIGLGQVLLMLFAVVFLVIASFKEQLEGLLQRFFHKSGLVLVFFFAILAFISISSYIIFKDLLDSIYLILLGFVVLTLIFHIPSINTIKVREKKSSLIFCLIWFVLFFWLGQGDEALLYQLLPYWQKLDPDRFILFSSIPLAILGGFVLDHILTTFYYVNIPSLYPVHSKQERFLVFTGLMISLIALNSIQLQRHTTDPTLYRENNVFPNEILTYFEGQEDSGRILPIHCPNWIYSFPVIGGNKPIIDGWYPQGRLLTPIRSIRSYSINYLSLDANRTEIWSNLIKNAENLAIGWIFLGDAKYADLIPLNEFTLELYADGIFIYKAKFNISMIATDPDYLVDKFVLRRYSAEKFVIEVKALTRSAKIIIKEAYFPYWNAYVSDIPVAVSKNADGFIQLNINQTGDFTIELKYEEKFARVAGASFLVLFGIPFLLEIYRRNFYEKNKRLRKLFNL